MEPGRVASLLAAILCLIQAAASSQIAQEAAAAASNRSSTPSTQSAGTWLLVAEPQQLSRIDLEASVPRRQLLERSPHIGGMDLLASDGRVFWSETSTGRIYARPLAEMAAEARCVFELSPREWRPRAVAVLDSAERLYALDTRGKRVLAIELRSGAWSVLLEGRLSQPADLAVDGADEGLMFVADRSRIVRSRLDGSEVQLLLSQDRYRIDALALDPANRRVLWADLAYHRIKSASYEGDDVRVLLKNRVGQGLSVLGPAQLAFHRQILYYYDDVYRRISALQLDERGRLIRGTNASVVYDGLDARSIKLVAV